MSRRVFASAVLLLLLVVMLCCDRGAATAQVENNADASTSGPALTGDITAEGSASGGVVRPQRIDLFVPKKTLVLPKEGTAAGTPRDSFVAPSLVSAGGVIAAFAEGRVKAQNTADAQLDGPSSDVVAEYMDSSWDWTTLVDNVNKSTWRAHTVLTATEVKNQSLVVFGQPTTISKGNKVFLLSKSSLWSYPYVKFYWDRLDLKLVVGTVTNSTGGKPSKRIVWGAPKLLLSMNFSAASYESKFKRVFPSGGSGVLMEEGTIVFPLMARNEAEDVYSMIIYSTDDGAKWMLSNGTSPAKCFNPHITEWEGSLLMIVDCEGSQRVYESRDMGTTWTEATGTLSGVWTKSKSKVIFDLSFRVGALITASIEGRNVMLYTQRGDFSRESRERALYLWVTDNNRLFCVGLVAMEDGMDWLVASSLLYSDGNLHLLQQRDSFEGSALSLSRLTEELSTINSVLSTWAQKDAFFSSLTIPTAGLVAVLSNALSGGDTWIDEYLCLNATVTPNAKKVRYGFQLTEPDSRVSWSVNTRANNVRHVSLSHNFTLVASVTIEETPNGNTPLLTATLADTNSNHTMGLSYTENKTWGTGLKGKKTTQKGSWEPKKGYQVALMLQGKKASVYIDGASLGEEEVPLTGEAPLELVRFCFGACGMKNSPVTVMNVFLYNRPLSSTEINALKDKAHTLNGPGRALAGWAALEGAAAREHAAVVGLTSAGSGLLPLLLLLGLWGFAAA